MDCSDRSRQTARRSSSRKRLSRSNTSSHRHLNICESNRRREHNRNRVTPSTHRSRSSSYNRSNGRDDRVRSRYRKRRSHSRSESHSKRRKRSFSSHRRRYRDRSSRTTSTSSESRRDSIHHTTKDSDCVRNRHQSSNHRVHGAHVVASRRSRSKTRSNHGAARPSTSRRQRSNPRSSRSRSQERRRGRPEGESVDNVTETASRVSPHSKWRGKTSTVMIRELPTSLNEAEIRDDLMTLGFTITDLRLLRRKDTGESRGFGFIDLISQEETEKFLNYTKGHYLLMNQFPVTLTPSPPRWDAREDQYRPYRPISEMYRDWECVRCGIRNFKRRDYCFKCNLSKEESDRSRELDGSEAISAVPCATILLRGLHPKGVENDRLLDIIEDNIINLNIHPLNAFVVKSDEHDQSQQNLGERNAFAFVEFSSIHEATIALERLKSSKPSRLFIDDYQILVDFARAAFTICIEEYTGVNKGESFRQTSAAISSYVTAPDGGSQHLLSDAGLAVNSADPSLMAAQNATKDPLNVISEATTSYSLPPTVTYQANVGAAVAQAALQNLHALKHRAPMASVNLEKNQLSSERIKRSPSATVETGQDSPMSRQYRNRMSRFSQSAGDASSIGDQFKDDLSSPVNTTDQSYIRFSEKSSMASLQPSDHPVGYYGTAASYGAIPISGINTSSAPMYWDGSQWYVVAAPLTDAQRQQQSAEGSVSMGTGAHAYAGGCYYDPSSDAYTAAHAMVGNTAALIVPNMATPGSTVFIDHGNSQQHAAGGEPNSAIKQPLKMKPSHSAKKIAKEMEKWASTQNKQKANSRKSGSSLGPMGLAKHPSLPAAASALSAQRQQMQHLQYQTKGAPADVDGARELTLPPALLLTLSTPPPLYVSREIEPVQFADEQFITRRNWRPPATSSSACPMQNTQVVGEAPPTCSNGETDDAAKAAAAKTDAVEALIDWTNLACFLCKRKFNSAEILRKHIELSALHKENMEKLKKLSHLSLSASNQRSLQESSQYRDRAKERRDMYSTVTK